MQDVENLFLEVGRAIEGCDIASAKDLLEEILLIDPAYSRAHNHLGWIYETRLEDFEKAKRHYELAIKFSKGDYPVAYVNYAYLLIRFERFEEAEKIIEEGLKIQGADYATLMYQKGKIAEARGKYTEACRYYILAGKLSFDKNFIIMLDQEFDRVKAKMNFWQKLLVKIGNF
ncbi:MAG: hypothetical protein WBA59_04505 [Moheibacter sp.]